MSDPEGAAGKGRFQPGPVTFPEMARASWRLYRAHFGDLFKLFLIAWAVLAIGQIAVGLGLQIAGISDVSVVVVYLAAVAAMTLVVGGQAFAIASALVKADLAGQEVSLRDALGSVRPRAQDVLTAALVMTIPALVVLFSVRADVAQFFVLPLFIGPPILVQAMAIEEKGFRDAAQRARSLLSGHWLRMVLYLLTIVLGTGVAQIIVLIALGGAFIEVVGTGAAAGAVFSVVGTIVAAVVLPYFAMATVVGYFDLRSRAEGSDQPGFTGP